MKITPLKGKEIKKVINIFVKENVLLYHGISPTRIPDTLKSEIPYEQKVRYCLTGAENDGISCSTIASNDQIKVNFFEPVGLIIKPIEILLCNHCDMGYSKSDGIELFLNLYGNPTYDRCKESIIKRDTLNEFIVTKYEVLGVGISFQNIYSDYAEECKGIALEFDIRNVIGFGSGFVNKAGDTITASDVYRNA